MISLTRWKIISFLSICIMLNSCYKPPFNDFKPDQKQSTQVVGKTLIGAGAGAVVGSVAGNTGAGAVIGGVIGATSGLYKSSHRALLKELQQQDIQYIEYGDTRTLLVPTDKYFVFNTPHLNDICYPGLKNIVKLIKSYPPTPIYIASFSDDVGTRSHKKRLTQARAETMLTFLWAHDVPARLLHAEGYGSQHDIGDNKLIRGSAYNRRIEIQWLINPKIS